MDLNLARRLSYIKNIPVTEENERLIRNGVQSLFFKAACESMNAETACEKYFAKAMITGCRDILRELWDLRFKSQELGNFYSCSLAELLRPVAAACTFLLSPVTVILRCDKECLSDTLLCKPQAVLWCTLSLIEAAARSGSDRIIIKISRIKNSALISVKCTLPEDAEIYSDEISREAAICKITADMHSGQSFYTVGSEIFAAGFSIERQNNKTNFGEAKIFSTHELLADRLSPIYAALSREAPCFI